VRRAARFAGALGALVTLMGFGAPPADAAALGQQRVLAILASYGARPYSSADVTSVLNQANVFFRRSSFGQMSLQTTVTPWLAAGTRSPGCSGGGTDGLFGSLHTVASRADLHPGAYDEVLYFVGGDRCGFLGVQNGTEAVLVGPISAHLVVHELGHTFGLPHAAAAPYCPFSWCLSEDQGDLYDPMGAGFVDFGAYEKEYLGWILPQPRVTRSGRYVVYPMSTRKSAHEALVIESADEQYWLEQRPDRATPGLIVRIVRPGIPSGFAIPQSTLLLSPIRPNHAVITPGQTFRMPGQFSATVVRGGTGLRLKLSLAAAR